MWRYSCYGAAVIMAYGGTVLLFFTGTQIEFLGAPMDAGAMVMGARTAPLFLAMALLYLVMSPVEPGVLRSRFAAVSAFYLSLIAVLGVWHWMQGMVTSAVFPAVAAEAVMAAVFLAQIRSR